MPFTISSNSGEEEGEEESEDERESDGGSEGEGEGEGEGTVMVPPLKDATLYESMDGTLANGSGQNLFVGLTLIGEIRRAIIAFDVAGAVPQGAIIEDATLQLSLNQAGSPAEFEIGLHRANRDWNEGPSDPFGVDEGTGTSAVAGDTTWLHTSFDSEFWAMPGGDFEAVPSATQTVGDALSTHLWDGPSLVADVQSWFDDPGSNFGWFLVGNEEVLQSAKRFASRGNSITDHHPRLVVHYYMEGEGEGESESDGEEESGAEGEGEGEGENESEAPPIGGEGEREEEVIAGEGEEEVIGGEGESAEAESEGGEGEGESEMTSISCTSAAVARDTSMMKTLRPLRFVRDTLLQDFAAGKRATQIYYSR